MDLSNIDLQARGAGRPRAFTSPAEINRHIEQARVLRSQATAAMLGTAWRALARPLRAPAAAVAGWWQRRATEAALMRCSDRVLADVGIERENIPLVARGLDPSAAPAATSAGWRRWPALLAHVEGLAMIRRGAGHGHPQTVADRA